MQTWHVSYYKLTSCKPTVKINTRCMRESYGSRLCVNVCVCVTMLAATHVHTSFIR